MQNTTENLTETEQKKATHKRAQRGNQSESDWLFNDRCTNHSDRP